VVECFCHGVSHGLCSFTFDFSYQGEGVSALNQTDNGLPMVFTIEDILMGNAFQRKNYSQRPAASEKELNQ